MTPSTLKEYTLKDLAQMAKKRGILGWHSMRKDDLIRAIVRDAKHTTKRGTSATAAATSPKFKRTAPSVKPSTAGNRNTASRAAATMRRTAAVAAISVSTTPATTRPKAPASPRKGNPVGGSAVANTTSQVAQQIQQAQQVRERLKDLSNSKPKAPADPASMEEARREWERRRAEEQKRQREMAAASQGAESRDRVVLMVRDPYWLHVHWELSSRSIQRAQAAMAEHWHTAKPVIRLLEVPVKGTTSSTEMMVRDIEIHGGVSNWYIDVVEPPKGYRVEIGYLSTNGRFHSLARSNSVMTPQPGLCNTLDHNWLDVAENCERIFALSGGYSAEGSSDELQEVLEERLQRPVGVSSVNRYGVGADPNWERDNRFQFNVDAEMIIYGTTRPDAHVTLGGEPIKLRSDGTFTVRMSLPDRRQVLPMTSSSRDGSTQQTIVLAIERNTKIMEPISRDANQ